MEKEIVLFDKSFCVSKRFSYKEFRPCDNMGRNDSCFCGSGKKQKRCHPDIHEKSVMASVLAAYNRIDTDIAKRQKHSICCKGCNNCCADYFKVSLTEFFSILYCLGIGSSIPIKYSGEAKAIVRDIYLPEDDCANVPDFPGCIFIDELTGGCNIYEVRPSLCRLYGSVSGITRCEKIMVSEKAMGGLFSLDAELAAASSFNIDFVEESNAKYELPHHPIIYWFSKLDETGGLKERRMRDLFAASYDRPTDSFVKILLL